MDKIFNKFLSYFQNKGEIELFFESKYGGFDKATNEYVINHGDSIITPRPWANVISNKAFGTIVTESSLGTTWFDNNSKDRRISPWSNDAVLDIPSEVVFIKDNDSKKFWTTTRLPIGNIDAETDNSYRTVHGRGYSYFESSNDRISHKHTVFVDIDDEIKINLIKLKNKGNKSRSLSLYYYVDIVIGNYKNHLDSFIQISKKPENNIINITRDDLVEKGKQVFVSANLPISSWTNNKNYFIGYNNELSSPQAIRFDSLESTNEYPKDNCCVVKIDIVLKAGESKELIFLLGAAINESASQSIVSRYITPEQAKLTLKRAKYYWDNINSQIIIKTPDKSIDVLFNNWILYQTLSCRIWGRSSIYQSSGAYGFRDQLQDVMAMLYVDKNMCRNQIINAASRQFEEGDVQHWWFPDSSMGVRNRVADSPLWLPYVVNYYIEKTGDATILDEQVPFLKGTKLQKNQSALVEVPLVSEMKGTIWEHCIKSINKVSSFGIHGLPLIKEGDWNDGMNSVGIKGKGESIWLGWFLGDITNSFIRLSDQRGEGETQQKLINQLKDLKISLHDFGWDEKWYLRAYNDEEVKLGSAESEVCQIDSISQSWAVLTNLDSLERQEKSLEAAVKYLVDEENELGKLFTPAFDNEELYPGYIKDYVPGIRENGGQYSHALFWLIMALCLQGKNEVAYRLLNYTNPIYRSSTEEKLNIYELEPYIIAGDIYSSEQHMGKGGWSWYTASSGLIYRTVLESILGFKLFGDKLRFVPCVPSDWKEFSIDYKYKTSQYSIKFDLKEGHNNKVQKLIVDDETINSDIIDLVDDGKRHKVIITIENNS